ncbi:hypothetical protein BDY21DRAFT_384381 [Lineolata rhizophorae]|uniref:BZIP domain-containing protein n=1 Tax=Lineolata rhizophorae TaxID=578093 RepID=A0A6A6P7F6_9PEZI|nr:hypothetical protein BDY21DRAFT_384381 [Lineolata rhizophorae]
MTGLHLDYSSRPSSAHPVDRKPSLFDNDFQDDDFMASSIMSPLTANRRESFTHSGVFSPGAQSAILDEYNTPVGVPENVSHTNPFYGGRATNNNNPFTHMDSAQAANYGQHFFAQQSYDAESKPVEFSAQDYDQSPAFFPNQVAGSSFGGLPMQSNVRPASVFGPSTAIDTPTSASPHPRQEWMAMAEHEVESRPANKRTRLNSPPRSASQMRDGIRKKNHRFEIPPERSLNNIDELIQNSKDDNEIKELKQQKRLLRNRQAALDSRQRKKKHTEELEEEKKNWGKHIQILEERLGTLQIQLEQCDNERQDLARRNVEAQEHIHALQWEREEMVRQHTLETGDLRKKITVLSEGLEATANSTAMSATASSTGFNEFTADLGALDMGNEFDDILVRDYMESTPTPTSANPSNDTAVVVSRKADIASEDKPVTSGMLLMLLLCGAFVASKSSTGSTPVIPRVSDEVRAASAHVLDSIFKDAGVAPSSQITTGNPNTVISRTVSGLEPGPSGDAWQASAFGGAGLSFGDMGSGTPLDALASQLITPSKSQEAEQAFSITPAQHNSYTSADYTRRVYASNDEGVDALSPGSQAAGSSPRRNLAEALAAMREQRKGDGAAEVYTRSLLWESIPRNVVQEFNRMVEESNGQGRKAGDGNAGVEAGG